MSIKLHPFIAYVTEAFGIYFKNIHTIFGITLLINILALYAPATFGTYILSIIRPDYYTSDGLTISISSAGDVLFCIAAALLVFLVIIAYDAILSVYAFYITFKSNDEDYRLFLSMIKAHLWNILKTKFVAFSYILIGLICFIIPGIILMLRYAAINYFVMVYGSKFPDASNKSTDVMDGFKLVFLVLSIAFVVIDKSGVDYFQSFIEKSTYSPALYAILYLSIVTIFSTLNVVSSIVTYSLCKHEADQAVAAANAATEEQTAAVLAENTISAQAHPQSQPPL